MTKKKEMKPLLKIFLKASLFTLIIALIIGYIDFKGYFNPSAANDHTLRKWNTFYDLERKRIEIDVMLIGNSHLYTGINPKNLGLNLGTNAFILASPGTNTTDNYYALKEALSVHKPKLVVIETYGANNSTSTELKDGSLSNQIVSFNARKNFPIKLASTPYLFSTENYFYAWSTTIRNHDYLFTNSEQLKENKKIIEKKLKPFSSSNKLYLGRYVRFTSGIKEEVLNQYKTKGAPVNGKDFKYSKATKYYIGKIKQLCERENIPLLFLTLPMYDKHVSNYSVWNQKLKEMINPKTDNWINMQLDKHYIGFDAFAFESTYKVSQHMTYNGSIIATYKLANFIKDSMNIELPDRTKDNIWHNMYYGDEGYFENFTPVTADKQNKTICRNKQFNNVDIHSVSVIKLNNKNKKIIAKIKKTSFPNKNYYSNQLNLQITFEHNGIIQQTKISLKPNNLYQLHNEVLFSTVINNYKINEVISAELIFN